MSAELSDTILANIQKFGSDTLVSDARTGEDFSGEDFFRIVQELKGTIDAFDVVCIDGTSNLQTIALVALCALEKKTVVPLAPSQPSHRIESALNQLRTSVWVDPRLEIAPHYSSPTNQAGGNLGMYVLFTSGSTGDPKGVKVSRDNLLHSLAWTDANFGRGKDEVIGLASMAYFDIGLFEILYSLYFGHPMVLFSDRTNPFAVRDDLTYYRVSSFFTAPKFLSQLSRAGATEGLRQESSLTSVISGGDFLEPGVARDWINQVGCRVLNVWGPSETSVVNTVHEISIVDVELAESGQTPSLPIGNIAHDMEVRIISESGSQLEPGSSGELVVFGPAVSLGYITNRQQSGFQYVEGRSCFRTGDRGFRTSDGLLFIEGRSATIIKSAGYRIDPRELEFWITKLPEVLEAYVVPYARNSETLVGVVVVRQGMGLLTLAGIRRHLRTNVPTYMLPKRLLVVDKVPLNVNGKVDRKRLSELLLGEEV